MLENLKRFLNDFLNNYSTQEKLNTLRLPAALVLIAVLLPYVNAHWYWPGLAVSLSGLVLQLWIFGSARGTERLSINGPYVFVRNPLCIARFLLILGLVLMTGIPWLLPVYVVLYVLWAMYRVQHEEEVLHEKETSEYLKYSKHVSRFLPRFKPYPRGRFLYFKTKYFNRHHGWENLLVFTGLYILCYVIAYYPD